AQISAVRRAHPWSAQHSAISFCPAEQEGTAPSPLADFDGAFPALLRFIRANTSEFRPKHTTRLLHRGGPRLADGFRAMLSTASRYVHSLCVASAAPDTSASIFAQQISGCTRLNPQSVPAMMFCRPTILA